MRKKIRCIVLIELILMTSLCQAQIFINEIGANNESVIADTQGEFDDWIEIYNAGNSAINLADYYFTDDLSNRTKWEMPATNAAKTTVH